MIHRTGRLLLILSFLFFTAGLITAQEGFEGKIKYKITDQSGQDMFMTYITDGENVRMEMDEAGGQGAGVMLFKDQKMYVLMPDQQKYMVISDTYNEEWDPEENKEEFENFKNSYTGEDDEIMGYAVKKYDVKEDDGTRVEMWLASDMGNFVAFQNPMEKEQAMSWQDELGVGGFFPLKVVAYNESGEIDNTMEAMNIEKQSVASSQFEIPSGYEKFDMNNMMKDMMKQMQEKMD